MPTTSHPVARFLPPVAVTAFNVGWDMIGYQNPTLGYVLWGVAAVLLFIAAWPWIKRWRPFTLVPADSETRTVSESEQLEYQNQPQHQQAQETVLAAEGALGKLTVIRGTDERPLVQDDELWEPSYNRRSFWMAEFARKTAQGDPVTISDRRLYDCRIYGPVVFGPLTQEEIERTFVDCEWVEEEDEEREFAFLPPGDYQQEEGYVGVVRLENCRFTECRFTECRFSRVGILRIGN